MNQTNKTLRTMFLTIAVLSGMIGAAALPNAFASLSIPDIRCYGVLNCNDVNEGSEPCEYTTELHNSDIDGDPSGPQFDPHDANHNPKPVVCVPEPIAEPPTTPT